MTRSIFFLILLSLPAISLRANNGFTIKGTIRGGYTGYIYLSSSGSRDSAYVEANSFEFTGAVEKPKLAWLHLQGDANAAWVYLENSVITVTGDFSTTIQDSKKINLYLITGITGSYSQKLFDEYRSFYTQNSKKENFTSLRFDALKNMFASNPKQPVTGYILGSIVSNSSYSYEELWELFTLLDTTALNTDDLNMINTGLRTLNRYGAGQPFVDFALPDQFDNVISSASYRGKITLIDLWASWCGPCRAKHPQLTDLYKKFSGKGFNLVSITIDTDKTAWRRAIEQDGLAWDNLFDADSRIKNELNLMSIPSNYLLDENGIVIAVNQSLEKINLLLQEKLK